MDEKVDVREATRVAVGLLGKTQPIAEQITKLLRELEKEIGYKVILRSVRPAMQNFQVTAQVLLDPKS